jgi:hypothetical protein
MLFMVRDARQWFTGAIMVVLFYIPDLSSQEFTRAIEDNSYFIEEAYNQETGVIQHISNGYYQTKVKDFLYSFTEEWPVGCQTHQLSLTVPYQSFHAGSNGFGDIYINYRYQWWDDNNWGWISPRLSVILPTGKPSIGLGSGVFGMQINIPVSKRWSNELISHFNIGTTVLPNVKGMTDAGTTVHQTLTSYFAGTSGIWLLSENFNLMCEVLFAMNASINGAGNIIYSHQAIISPGFRFAINMGALQIVPGFAFPIVFESSNSMMNIFAYLSFEHPY